MLRSLSTRISRAVFGVLSIWCLGCSSLDIIIDRLVHGGGDASGCVMSDDAPAPAGGDGTSIVEPTRDRTGLDGCGCDRCVAVQTPATGLAATPHPTPESVEHRLGSALSVYREPLVPPPIGLTIA
ncbi:MAG: hypothetical protein WD825_12765 [Gemmatimonadaceae bacterium]